MSLVSSIDITAEGMNLISNDITAKVMCLMSNNITEDGSNDITVTIEGTSLIYNDVRNAKGMRLISQMMTEQEI